MKILMHIIMTYFFYQERLRCLLCNVGTELSMPSVHPHNIGSKLFHNKLTVEDFWQPLNRLDIAAHQGAGPQTYYHSLFGLEPTRRFSIAIENRGSYYYIPSSNSLLKLHETSQVRVAIKS